MSAGTCLFSEKALHAQDAGAAGVLIYDNELGAYFTFGADQSVGEWLGGCRVGFPVDGGSWGLPHLWAHQSVGGCLALRLTAWLAP